MYSPILFFYQGTIAEGEAFFRRYWPEARGAADLSKRFYTAFGIDRGGIREMFGARVWAAGLRAALKGNFSGAPVGDPWTMPGLVLVRGDTIIWKHRFRHAGDHPDFARIVEQIPSGR